MLLDKVIDGESKKKQLVLMEHTHTLCPVHGGPSVDHEQMDRGTGVVDVGRLAIHKRYTHTHHHQSLSFLSKQLETH